MLDSIKLYLASQDPVLGDVIRKTKLPNPFDSERSHFETMSRIIVGQQLSVSAASAVWSRVRHLASRWTPRSVLQVPDAELRRAGLSASKTRYLKSLCHFVASGQIDFAKLAEFDDVHLTHKLELIRGVGPWSVEMFLIFGLGRPDIFSMSDAGLRRAIIGLYGISLEDYSHEVMTISEPWKPYRSYACRYLWSSLDK